MYYNKYTKLPSFGTSLFRVRFLFNWITKWSFILLACSRFKAVMVVNFDHTSSNPVRNRRTIIFEYGPIPASFRFFTSVSHNNFNNTNGKIVDDVLEIRTRGSIMVGEDETTELRWPILTQKHWLKRTYINKR